MVDSFWQIMYNTVIPLPKGGYHVSEYQFSRHPSRAAGGSAPPKPCHERLLRPRQDHDVVHGAVQGATDALLLRPQGASN